MSPEFRKIDKDKEGHYECIFDYRNEWVAGKVKSGQYKSSSEVLRDGLRLLQNKEEQRQAMLKELRHELLIGVKQLDTDKSQFFNANHVSQIKNRGRQKLGI